MKRNLFGLIVVVILLAVVGAATAAPADAATPVTKAQREVVVFSPGLAQGTALEAAFYDFVEFNAIALATATLGTRYNALHIVRGAAATRAGLANTLNEITSRATIRAVDLVFITHGATDEVLLADDRWTIGEVRDRIRAGLTLADRAKLRVVFSTACFGESHRTAWREAGFKTVSGSREIYADSASSYLPFLSSWAVGSPFGIAVTAANVAGLQSGWDLAASAWYLGRGKPVEASQIDSFRLMTGSTGLTIATMP
jgi:hypothetical protein